MVMPVMDGDAFLKKLKKLDKEYKVIVLSNNNYDHKKNEHKVLMKSNVRLADLPKHILDCLTNEKEVILN